MVEPSETLQLVFDKAIKDARRLNHEYVTVEHLLFAMIRKALKLELEELLATLR